MEIIINSSVGPDGKRHFFWYEPDNKEKEGTEILQIGGIPVRELDVKDGKLLLIS